MNNYKMVIAYDGTRYNGWQKQGNTNKTIQGKMEAILEKMTGEQIEIHGSGRTDAGVHALGQVANAKLNTDKTPEQIQDYINEYLPKDIVICSIEKVSMRFHSRLNAVRKTYCYRIHLSPVRNVFERSYVWDYGKPLDIERMKQAAQYLLGEHDFLPFCDQKNMKKSSVRTVERIDWKVTEKECKIFFCGNGFLYHMVRKIVGMLVKIGEGNAEPEEIRTILETGNRELTAGIAPAEGLCLMNVEY
ncbi:MAG: tRNA pseudouridine(38-40) synthase TruA [Clostridiales bacterium]|nr:tRNA pseudouridine(38-40) synthase TruA [Clostridiales bacterium]